ncbi:MAG: GNAT family N-acetyltransferase [Patescibacteria group bacterium]
MQITYSFIETFSELQEDDTGQIASLLSQLSPQRQFSPSQLRRAMMFGSLCVARDTDSSGKIVGMALLVYRHTALYSSGTIESVVVDDAYRGQKIGKELMNHLIEKARRYPGSLAHLDLTSNPARVAANALYKKLGFTLRETNSYRMIL